MITPEGHLYFGDPKLYGTDRLIVIDPNNEENSPERPFPTIEVGAIEMLSQVTRATAGYDPQKGLILGAAFMYLMDNLAALGIDTAEVQFAVRTVIILDDLISQLIEAKGDVDSLNLDDEPDQP